jgi:hypothetical protein
MIKKLLLASLITIAGIFSLAAQYPIHVYGAVTNANGGGQDSVNLWLSVFYTDSTFCQAEAWTGVDGNYDVVLDCPPNDPNGLGYVQVNMIDCNNNVQTLFFNTANGQFEFLANFEYCPDNNSDSCVVIIFEQENFGALNYLSAWTPPSMQATYLWSTGDTTQDIHPVIPGEYCVTATSGPLGCTANDCYWFSADTVGNCFAYIISFPDSTGNNSYILQAIGVGVAPYTYLWDNGSASDILYGVQPGTYCVVVSDATGCSFYTCVIVPDVTFCESYINEDPNGGLTVVGYGNSPFTYQWSTGETSPTIYPAFQGLYCATVTDASGCQSSSCYDFWTPIDSSCFAWVSAYLQDSTTLVIQAFPSGFGQSWSFLWNTGETTDIIYPLDPFQSYCVTITDNLGCVASACYDPGNWCYTWLDLQYLDTTTAQITAFNDPIFNFPGAGQPTYLWSTGDTTQTITTDSSGLYCVTVSLGTGCNAEACTYVDFDSLSTSCSAWVWQYPDSTGQQWLAQVYSWGWGTFEYQWSTGDTTDVIELDPNEYACVTVTSSFGCESVACTDTFYNPCTPVISVLYISNNQAVLTATSYNDPGQNGSFVWSTGDAGTVITVTASGTYCVTVTAGGCVGTACIDVFLQYNCGVSIAVTDTNAATIFTAVPWGTPPFQYQWDNGSTDQSIWVDFGPLDHCVYVTDATGCVASACTYLDSCQAYIYLEFTPEPTLQIVADFGIALVEWNTGNPGDSMTWLQITEPGTYCATITTYFGCTSTTCITVDSLNPAQGVNIINGFVVNDTIGLENATVHAYQMDNNNGNIFEEKGSAPVGQGGFYSISGLESGLYLVKVDFAAGSLEDDLYIPTYHYSATTWEAAEPHPLPNFLTVTTDIHLIWKQPLNGGGVIGGAVTDPNHIVAEATEETRNVVGLSNVLVLLNDVNGNPLTSLVTDEDGNFRFTNLPFGTYRLRYDIPGLSSPEVWVTLTAENPEKLQVALIAEGGTTAVSEPKAEVLHLYPNPTNAQINMAVPGNDARYEIQVLDMQGRIIYGGSARNYNGILTIDASQYSDGLYHINLLNEDHRFYGRFIKQE